MNKKIFLILAISIFLISIISADCCERLDSGAWCQNAPATECNSDYLSAPTSCEATSFCRLGTCIDTNEGSCMINTPERICVNNGGTWDERDKEEISQCQLGCCLIGEQAAFTTLTRCKSLSSFYGLEIDYRTDIQNEVQCISLSNPKVKGACVIEEEFQRNCRITTKSECQQLSTDDNSADFYEGYLCSAESLETVCGPRGGTTCVEGKDDVYFLDTCGNLANVYDYSRLNDQLYWETMMEPDCGDGEGNANSASCGDCDYISGSACSEAGRENNPSYGNYVCEDLSCEFEGERYEHGETWCATINGLDGGNPNLIFEEEWNFAGYDSPGSRYFRLVCYNGQVNVEPCADFRQEVCIQNEVNGFSTAVCRVNRWEDCYAQTNERDCQNSDQRDCQWILGKSILRDDAGNSLALDESSNPVEASCVPISAPGFDFWEETTDADEVCALGSTVCYVTYVSTIGTEGSLKGEKGIPTDTIALEKCKEEKCAGIDWGVCLNTACRAEDYPSKCVNNDGTPKDSWLNNMSRICSSIGDCGLSENYIQEEGYYKNFEEFVVKSELEGEEE